MSCHILSFSNPGRNRDKDGKIMTRPQNYVQAKGTGRGQFVLEITGKRPIFRYIGNFLNAFNRWPTSWIGHQVLKLVTNTFGLQHPSPTSSQPILDIQNFHIAFLIPSPWKFSGLLLTESFSKVRNKNWFWNWIRVSKIVPNFHFSSYMRNMFFSLQWLK